jgi:hypothetical protein
MRRLRFESQIFPYFKKSNVEIFHLEKSQATQAEVKYLTKCQRRDSNQRISSAVLCVRVIKTSCFV